MKSLSARRPSKTIAGMPAFMIVGTPRSGTTLVQRLACELPGVKVPVETQFFWRLAPRLIQGHTFPLGESELREELEWFIRRQGFSNGQLDVEVIVDELEGRCDHPLQLFGAMVRQLAGEAAVYGEKTPQHLFWWRGLSARLPELKFVAVVRHPHAVVASNLQVDWTVKSHVLLAERWSLDQKLIAMASKRLGPQRCLVMRYEDIVVDPSRARAGLASFLGLGEPMKGFYEPRVVPASEIMQPAESWKSNAVEKVSQDRVSAWQNSLTPRQVADVSTICRPGMLQFGYGQDAPGLAASTQQTIRLGVKTNYQRLRYRASRYRHLAHVRRMSAYL